jgi:hypothetical protein
MMNVEAYYDKIERMIESRKGAKTSAAKKRGLLAQSDKTATPKQKNEMMAIVEIIEGIREAREELTNGKK